MIPRNMCRIFQMIWCIIYEIECILKEKKNMSLVFCAQLCIYETLLPPQLTPTRPEKAQGEKSRFRNVRHRIQSMYLLHWVEYIRCVCRNKSYYIKCHSDCQTNGVMVQRFLRLYTDSFLGGISRHCISYRVLISLDF